MRDTNSRSGFTLIELMTASTIFVLVAASIFSAFLGGHRLLRMTMARTEMSLRARELRDKLLFNAAPFHDDTIWTGLLSGSKMTGKISVLEDNGHKLLMHADALKGKTGPTGETTDQTLEIRLERPTRPDCYLFSEDRHDQNWDCRWLHPGNMNLFAANNSTGTPVFQLSNEEKLLFINIMGRENISGNIVEHNERIVVPIFGALQKTEENGGGGL